MNVNPLRHRQGKGFTLIELLIVIAIILILIAIALPNFLEAQIRARVTKAKGEIRSLGIAMESYFLDWKVYPAESEDDFMTRGSGRLRAESGLAWLTSPTKYITTVPEDPFPAQDDEVITYESGGIEFPGSIGDRRNKCLVTWAIFSRGPFAVSGANPDEAISSGNPHFGTVTTYNPTNGTTSRGAIYLYGGDSFFIGVPIETANMAIARTTPPDPLLVDGVPYVHRLPPPLK